MNRESNNDTYYWCCEHKFLRKCKGRAITILEGQDHILKKFNIHNHAPETSRTDVIQTLNNIRERALQTREKPSQIIQDIVINMPEESFSYMPSNEAIRKQISHARNKNMPTQPQTLENINVLDQLRTTIRGEQFLAKDIEFNNEKIMIFCTSNNLQYLEKARYWLMDGTFKTVPTLFRQLYTIHAIVGGEKLINLGYEAGYDLSPPIIITDFEQAVINSIRLNFSNSANKCCFFHLCQSLWRQIQAKGLSIEYGANATFSIKLRQLTAFAFLLSIEIPAAFDQIKPLMPSNATSIVNYFENTYIREEVRQQLRNGNIIYDPPTFSLSLWSIFELITHGYPRTQNFIEGWHHRWNNIVGRAHVGVYTIIEEIRKEQHQTDINIERVLRGEPRPSQPKHVINYERRIQAVFSSRNDYTLPDYLREIAHNISL
ncbi:24017_t:CDS:2 [Gigaspora rosea]|nr:24017_t:CDS:2 [Gigaspora rosea]